MTDQEDSVPTGGAGRTFDVGLRLLDRQVIDADGQPVCKVDDLELELDEYGRPYITAILVGPRALGPRLGGRLGRWFIAVARRLSEGQDPQPPHIDFAHVTDIGSAITLSRRRDELDVTALETWVDTHLISRIPGSRHESQ
jgi:sporulation protein YlmC with PRC-barrel domain